MTLIRTRSTQARFSRRAFLHRLGASAALLPLLDAERVSAATPSAFPKRLVTIAWSNGVAETSFYPPASETDPTASAILQPLAPLKSKVTLVTGIDYQVMVDLGFQHSGHAAYPTMFTGTCKNVGGENFTATGPSIDQVVSDAIAKTVNLRVPLLVVTVQGQSTSFRADGTRNPGETDPARVFNSFFATRSLSPAELDALRARRKSVLDFVGTELVTFGQRLGTDDRNKIEAHEDSIRRLELSLVAPPAPDSCVAVDPGAPTEYQASMKAFADLIAMGLRCDLTRTVSAVWADDGGSAPYTMPFLDLGSDDGSVSVGQVHGIAHQGPSGYARKIRIDTWYTTQLAYLAFALDGVPEGSGTLLDNSIIVMGNDMAEGSIHANTGVPFILVGGAGGALKAGRIVRPAPWFGKPSQGVTSSDIAALVGNLSPTPPGVDGGSTTNNHLLASISNLMDVPTTSFGTGYAGTLSALG